MIESRDPHLAGGEIMIFASGCAILTKVTYHMNLQDELILRNQGFVWEMFNVGGHIEINGPLSAVAALRREFVRLKESIQFSVHHQNSPILCCRWCISCTNSTGCGTHTHVWQCFFLIRRLFAKTNMLFDTSCYSCLIYYVIENVEADVWVDTLTT